MKSLIWLTYDLSVGGDYEGLYAWLDNKKAKECCESVAYLSFDYQENILEELEQEIKDNINIGKRDRLYVVFKKQGKKGKYAVTGKFLFGNRKSPPWTGFGDSETSDDEFI